MKSHVELATPPRTAAERARLFAEVNGERITSGDVEDALGPLIQSVQEQVHQLRSGRLDMLINDILLKQQATAKQTTTAALLNQEVVGKAKQISGADAERYYRENKGRIQGEYASVKQQIMDYLQVLETRDAEKAYAAGLRRAASVQIFLPAPPPARKP